MKLDIGLGTHNNPDYTTVDLYLEADIQATMWKIPLPDKSVEEIFCKYALEHIPKSKVLPTLLEWKRLLTDNGEIIVQVPDMLWMCSYFLGAPGRGRSMDYFYGGQSGEGDFHMTGFTIPIMEEWVYEAGLKIVKHDQYKEEDYMQDKFWIVKK